LGYKPLNNWKEYFDGKNPLKTLNHEGNDKKHIKSTGYMVEAAGIEPASASPLPLALHA